METLYKTNPQNSYILYDIEKDFIEQGITCI